MKNQLNSKYAFATVRITDDEITPEMEARFNERVLQILGS